MEDGAALGPGHRSPGRERGRRSLGRCVNIGGVAGRNLGQYRIVDRAQRLEGLARAALHRLAGYEMPDGAALELREITLGLVNVGG